MIVLGLETSCDETGLALYDSELGLRGQVLYSQIKLHAEYGGVVPELASRDHVRKLIQVSSFRKLEGVYKNIKHIGVTINLDNIRSPYLGRPKI